MISCDLCSGLNWFQHVKFVGSPQDTYVPIVSAMAEFDPLLKVDDGKCIKLIVLV